MNILCYLEGEQWIKQMAGAASSIGAEAYAVTPNRRLAEKASRYFQKIYSSDMPPFQPNLYLNLLSKASEETSPQLTLLPCTSKGRTLAGLYSGVKKIPLVSDVISVKLEGREGEVERLVYGGTATAKLRVSLPFSACIVSGAFPESERELNGEVIELEVEAYPGIEVEFREKEATGLSPDRAEIVVVAGRGVKKREDLEMIKELAEVLGGAWSVTRPLAADYGWAETWVGISGLTISPKLYLAVGVSGQPLHLVGAKNSKLIAAVNNDSSAPIFQESDYGIIGDLYQVIPILIKLLKRERRGK